MSASAKAKNKCNAVVTMPIEPMRTARAAAASPRTLDHVNI
jgi:hypothetical protein